MLVMPMRYLAIGLQELNTRQVAPQSVADNSYRIIINYEIIFSPKMPALPPVQPPPEPPSTELSQEEKERIAKEQAEIERKRRGRKINNTYITIRCSRKRRGLKTLLENV